MKLVFALFVVLFVLVGSNAPVSAQTATGGVWLDNKIVNWNKPGAVLPGVPKGSGANLRGDPRCRQTARKAENAQDRSANSLGWLLFGPVQSHSGTVIIEAMSDADGMCRPNGFQAFVFVNGRYAGSLSPNRMDARTDGSLSEIKLYSPSMIVAEFARYADADPLCCPTRTSTVNYRVDVTPKGPLVVPEGVQTRNNQTTDAQPAKTSVIGTVSYRERKALPANAVIKLQISDVSKVDARSSMLAEATLETKGSQVPVPFEIPYDPSLVQQNASYAVSAKILVEGKLLFTTTTHFAVITRGNPTMANLVLQRVTN